MGYELSPLLWKKIRRGLSAGRVQSVAMRLVADREKEIADFVPQEYWTLDALLKNDQGARFNERYKLFRDAHGFRQAAAHAKEQKPRKYNARKHTPETFYSNIDLVLC